MTATISRILGVSPERARLVNGFLRCEYRTLDHLSAQQIRTAYVEIAECIDADPVMADRLAASYGL